MTLDIQNRQNKGYISRCIKFSLCTARKPLGWLSQTFTRRRLVQTDRGPITQQADELFQMTLTVEFRPKTSTSNTNSRHGCETKPSLDIVTCAGGALSLGRIAVYRLPFTGRSYQLRLTMVHMAFNCPFPPMPSSTTEAVTKGTGRLIMWWLSLLCR